MSSRSASKNATRFRMGPGKYEEISARRKVRRIKNHLKTAGLTAVFSGVCGAFASIGVEFVKMSDGMPNEVGMLTGVGVFALPMLGAAFVTAKIAKHNKSKFIGVTAGVMCTVSFGIGLYAGVDKISEITKGFNEVPSNQNRQQNISSLSAPIDSPDKSYTDLPKLQLASR